MRTTAVPQGDVGLLDSDVAITIGAGPAREVLLVHGRVALTGVEGVVPESLSQRRRYGEERAAAGLAVVDRPGTRMVRVALRPSWAGVIDFQTRFPGGGGVEEFRGCGR